MHIEMYRGVIGALSAACLVQAANAQTCSGRFLPAPAALNSGVTNGAIIAAVRDPAGGCVVIGSFTTIAGIAADRVARWDGTTFTPIGDGLPPTNPLHPESPRALLVLSNGDIMVSGYFLNEAGDGRRVAHWDGTEWSLLPFWTFNNIEAMTELPDGDVVFGGSFYLIPNNGHWHVARWDGATLHQIGDGLSTGTVMALRTTLDGNPVGSGNITNGIAHWTGTYWRSLNQGIQWVPNGQSLAVVSDLEIMPTGDILAAGSFNYAGGHDILSLARWDGTDWFNVATSAFTNGLQQIELLESGSIAGLAQIGTQGRREVRIWDGTASTRLPLPTSGLANFTGILEMDGEIILYGNFGKLDSTSIQNFSRYATTNAPWTAVHPETVTTSEGDTVVLHATPAIGYENVRVQWQRNGTFIADGPAGASLGGGAVTGADAMLASPTDGSPATLTITGAQFSDGGQYTAIFSNACGSDTSHLANVTVKPPCSACVADYDSNGGVDGGDIAAFFTDFENGAACADVDQNGGVDGGDLAVFFAAFESGAC